MNLTVFSPDAAGRTPPTDGRIIRRTFAVGRRRCTITIDPGMTAPGSAGVLVARWSPDVPRRRLTKVELAQYRAGRDAVLAEAAHALGGNVLLAEL